MSKGGTQGRSLTIKYEIVVKSFGCTQDFPLILGT